MPLRRNLRQGYHPSLFLAALGNGGLAVSFFMYLLFLVPRPKGTPIPTFDTLWPVLTGDPVMGGLIGAAALGILVFAFRHYRLLAWNLKEYALFKQTEAWHHLKQGNGEVSLMAIPLTLAMTVNVSFILGAVFVPGLWSVVEWLFPGALAAFAAIAVYGVRLFLDYFGRIIVEGRFDRSQNNNLSQLIAIFAFAMIGVGFAAPAAMSSVPATSTIGAVLSICFLSGALLLALVKTVTGFQDMMAHGISEEGSPSLWLMIPILTVSVIALVRINHGLAVTFGSHPAPAGTLVLITALMGVQLVFGLLGLTVMRRLGYFRDYLRGDKYSPLSFTLICPGVALFVVGNFFVHLGLIKTGLVDKYSLVHLALMLPLVYVQWKTIATNETLTRRLLKVGGGAEKVVGQAV
ncbi:TsoY family (seleno)protein [Roseospirillum parvum]|uniref:Voltage-dependent anion channel n=1 Tax=Roseospirillum parvum TaxID=83401 RepID=A0A1G7V8H4_9PROT|nr:hypothetical protein [Roseospirillum parvum]SDG55868.1 hypothetical protein SAMN05421742_101571 [Roseospirillum parvum]